LRAINSTLRSVTELQYPLNNSDSACS